MDPTREFERLKRELEETRRKLETTKHDHNNEIKERARRAEQDRSELAERIRRAEQDRKKRRNRRNRPSCQTSPLMRHQMFPYRYESLAYA